MTHAILFGARTYITDVIARCGARVSQQDEAKQLILNLPTDCPTCLALEAEDDAALAALSEKTRTPGKPDPDDEIDRSDTDEAEGFAEDFDEDDDGDDPDAIEQSER